MQKILRKRVFRELKDNFFRYLALGFLIMLGMYLIVSLVGAAETVIQGVDQRALANHMEDGEFQVFVPLTEEQLEKITQTGVTLEKMFYLDYQQKDDSVIRLFRTREYLNRMDIDKGKLPETGGEVALEKRYCEEHGIALGDTVSIGKENFTVSAIGSVPDYDAPYKEFSDSTVDSVQFGMAFITSEKYEQMKAAGNSMKSEEFVYAYSRNGAMTDAELKEKLNQFTITSDQIQDTYFQEYWDRTGGIKEELQDGIDELADGASELKEGLLELKDNNNALQDGSAALFDSYLKEASEGLADYGLKEELTEDNFESVLKKLKAETDSGLMRLKLASITSELKELKEYKDGVTAYTDSAGEAADGSEELSDGIEELQDKTDEFTEDYFSIELNNLTSFLPAEDNMRIKASSADQMVNKLGGLIAGIIVLILFTYVISVFVIHGIEKESSVIGSLYALGVRQKDLLIHYLMLPVIVTFLSGIIGTALGLSKWGAPVQMADTYSYYSVPVLSAGCPAYLLVYGIVLPPAIAALVNCIVIHKHLSRPVLALIRNEQKDSPIHHVVLGNMKFITKFRIRQMLRESRTGFAVIFGMFISMLIMMLGVNCYVMCQHINQEYTEDTKFDYMYTLKYPEENVPDKGEAAFAKTLKKEIYGYNLDVTVLGIEDGNPYFSAEPIDSRRDVVISSAMAQKYKLDPGDSLILTDEEEDMDYVFRVEAVTPYSTSFYVFMNIDRMRELFGEGDDYYNVVFSSEKLDIPSGRLYATTTREEIRKSSHIFIDMMMPMVTMMCSVSALIFCIVMYLMMKVMVDRASFSISLLKVFGYRQKEVKKLYLDGNFYIVAVGAAVCIPLSKKLMDAMYPLMVSNVACGMNLSFSWQLYLGIYAIIILLYCIIHGLLIHHLNGMLPSEVLKRGE